MINMTIVDFLMDRAKRNADSIAFRFLEKGDLDGPITEWTFSELFQQSIGVAEDIRGQGSGKKNILLLFPPGLDFVKAFYGCLLAGARPVPVPLPNPRSKNPLGRIINTAKVCGATTALTTKDLAEMAKSMGGDLPISFQAVSDKQGTDWTGEKPGMDDVAYLQFTSGSTGHPKGVCVSHGNAVSNLRVMGQMLRLKSTKPAMVWAPHYHDLCLVGHVLGPVYYGFESTLMSPMDFLMKPVRWIQAMSHYKIANTASPNFGYEYSARRIKPEECEGLDLSNWVIAGNGGEPVLPQTMDAFINKFGPYGFRPQTFMPTFGMAESVLFVAGLKEMSDPPQILNLSTDDLENHTVNRLDDADSNGRKFVSCGKPGADHTIIAVDPVTLKPSAPDQVGELWVKGPSVPREYWGLKDISEETFEGRTSDTNDGPYLRTGDLGFITDGEVFITGRLKDLIIIAGRNHYPSDIELTVQTSGAPVRPGASAAVSEEINGVEELVIIAEIDDRKIPSEEEGADALSAFWQSAVKSVQGAVSAVHGLTVRSIVFVEPRSLEKTSSGKPRRRYYKEQFANGKLAALYTLKSPLSN